MRTRRHDPGPVRAPAGTRRSPAVGTVGTGLGAAVGLGLLTLAATPELRAQDEGTRTFDPLNPTAGGTLSLEGLSPEDVVRIRAMLRRLEDDPAAVAAAAGAERDLDQREAMLGEDVDAATAAGVDASNAQAFEQRAAGRLDPVTEGLMDAMTPEEAARVRESADEVAERAPGALSSRVYGDYEREQLDAVDGIYDAEARASLLAEAGGRDVDDKSCAIWLCLPVAFALPGCGVAHKAMYKRLLRGKSPLPSFSGCSEDGGDRGYGVRRGAIKIGETVTIGQRPPGMTGPETITARYEHGSCPNALRDDPYRRRRLTGRHDPDPMPPMWWRGGEYGPASGEAEELTALFDAEVRRLRDEAGTGPTESADLFAANTLGAYDESDEVEFDGDATNDLAAPVAGPNLPAFRVEYCAPAYGWSQAVRDGYAYGETIFTELEPMPSWYGTRLDGWDPVNIALAEMPYPLDGSDPDPATAAVPPPDMDTALRLRAAMLRREDVLERARALVTGETPVDEPVRPEPIDLPEAVELDDTPATDTGAPALVVR